MGRTADVPVPHTAIKQCDWRFAGTVSLNSPKHGNIVIWAYLNQTIPTWHYYISSG